MSTNYDENDTLKETEPLYKLPPVAHIDKNYTHVLGDANVQTPNSLKGKPRTFKDELYTVIDSWHMVYGPLPWAKTAERYNNGDVTVAEKIINNPNRQNRTKLMV